MAFLAYKAHECFNHQYIKIPKDLFITPLYKHLRNSKPGFFNHLVMKEELIDHLVEINNQACSYLEILIKQLAKEENVTEK